MKCRKAVAANLHGCTSEAISQLGPQRTAGVIDLGIPVFELVSFIKHCHVPWDPEKVFQIAPTDQHDVSVSVSNLVSMADCICAWLCVQCLLHNVSIHGDNAVHYTYITT